MNTVTIDPAEVKPVLGVPQAEFEKFKFAFVRILNQEQKDIFALRVGSPILKIIYGESGIDFHTLYLIEGLFSKELGIKINKITHKEYVHVDSGFVSLKDGILTVFGATTMSIRDYFLKRTFTAGFLKIYYPEYTIKALGYLGEELIILP